MKPYFQVKFKDGSVFEVPTAIVANDRATYYHESEKDEFPTLDDALKDTTELFASDTYEIEDWAKNNMNWDDLAPHAHLVAYEPAERDWMNCELSFHDARAEVQPAQDGENILPLPLEFAMKRIAARGHVCDQTTFVGKSGQPVGALVMIQGGPDVVAFYSGGLNSLTQHLNDLRKAAQAAAPSEPATH